MTAEITGGEANMDEAQKEEIGAALDKLEGLLWFVANAEGVVASEAEADNDINNDIMTVAELRKIISDACAILRSDAFRGIPRDDDDDD